MQTGCACLAVKVALMSARKIHLQLTHPNDLFLSIVRNLSFKETEIYLC